MGCRVREPDILNHKSNTAPSERKNNEDTLENDSMVALDDNEPTLILSLRQNLRKLVGLRRFVQISMCASSIPELWLVGSIFERTMVQEHSVVMIRKARGSLTTGLSRSTGNTPLNSRRRTDACLRHSRNNHM